MPDNLLNLRLHDDFAVNVGVLGFSREDLTLKPINQHVAVLNRAIERHASRGCGSGELPLKVFSQGAIADLEDLEKRGCKELSADSEA